MAWHLIEANEVVIRKQLSLAYGPKSPITANSRSDIGVWLRHPAQPPCNGSTSRHASAVSAPHRLAIS